MALSMMETRHGIVDWFCFKIQTLLVTLMTQNQLREGIWCIFLEVEHSFPFSCIDVSRGHTPINFPSRRNSFNIENHLTTTVAASETFDGFHQQATASGSSQYVPASEVHPWLSIDLWSRTRKQVRGDVSNVSVEEAFSKGKRDRDLESVQTLSERLNFHVNLEQKAELIVQGECAEADMDIRNWEQRNAVFALCETIRELESRRLEL